MQNLLSVLGDVACVHKRRVRESFVIIQRVACRH